METITLGVDEGVKEKFFWLLEHFDENEIQILTDDKQEVLARLSEAISEVNDGSLSSKTKTLDDLLNEL